MIILRLPQESKCFLGNIKEASFLDDACRGKTALFAPCRNHKENPIRMDGGLGVT